MYQKFFSMRIRCKSVLVSLLLFISFQVYSYNPVPNSGSDSLTHNLLLLKRYLSAGTHWQFTDPAVERRLSGLISFVESEPIDTLIHYFQNMGSVEGLRLVERDPRYVSDSLSVAGYKNITALKREMDNIRIRTEGEFMPLEFIVPSSIFENLEQRIELIPEGEGLVLFQEGIYQMPDSLKLLDTISENMVQSPEDFRKILRLEQARQLLVERKRLQYNDSLIRTERQRLADNFKREYIDGEISRRQVRFADSVKADNKALLAEYNLQVSAEVNDSLQTAATWLAGYADLFDTRAISLVNLSNQSSSLVMSNAGTFFTRVWLKNRQNDSLSVLVQNIGKNNMQLVIEDAVTFTRFRQQVVKDFDFATLNRPSVSLDKVERRFQAVMPWSVGADGNVGFTQTYLSNWKKGGQSAMSILLVGRGYANYSLTRLKWENSLELRNGWIRPGEAMIQKNDDKIRLTSRLGLSAFQKWYYSSELDFETQFFNGYKYPDTENPISAFLAPGRFLAKVGLDYKPNNSFSLFISPLTSKTVFVIDTVKIDQTNYGIRRGHTSQWEPGINTDVKFKRDFPSGLSYETKYRMFINYLEPRERFEFDWENIINIRFTEYITMRAALHMIYDSKVLFDKLDKEGLPVLDASGQRIREPKLQLREFVTVGFSYRLNRNFVRAKAVK